MQIRTMQDFIRVMSDMRKAGRQRQPGWRYDTVEDFLLAHGRQWVSRPKPKTVKYGTMQECFRNAFILAEAHESEGWTYVEGYAGRAIPVHHAWAVDAKGHVVDNTFRPSKFLPPATDYFGVAFTLDFVRRFTLVSETWGILFNMDGDWSYMTDDPATVVHPAWRREGGS